MTGLGSRRKSSEGGEGLTCSCKRKKKNGWAVGSREEERDKNNTREVIRVGEDLLRLFGNYKSVNFHWDGSF